MAKIITLISSTAGVGKTHFGVNFAHRLAALGKRTCLFNADTDTTAAHRLLDIDPRFSLDDLISNRHPLEHATAGASALAADGPLALATLSLGQAAFPWAATVAGGRRPRIPDIV